MIKCVRSISWALDGAEWPLQPVSTLTTIFKGELFVSLLWRIIELCDLPRRLDLPELAGF